MTGFAHTAYFCTFADMVADPPRIVRRILRGKKAKITADRSGIKLRPPKGFRLFWRPLYEGICMRLENTTASVNEILLFTNLSCWRPDLRQNEYCKEGVQKFCGWNGWKGLQVIRSTKLDRLKPTQIGNLPLKCRLKPQIVVRANDRVCAFYICMCSHKKGGRRSLDPDSANAILEFLRNALNNQNCGDCGVLLFDAKAGRLYDDRTLTEQAANDEKYKLTQISNLWTQVSAEIESELAAA